MARSPRLPKVNGTWLIWFNGEPAYCCTPAQMASPRTVQRTLYVNTSMVGADQYVPGDHYGNQYRIWGGLTQLSLGMQELPPVALSAEAPSLLDSCRTIYTDAQMQIIEIILTALPPKFLLDLRRRCWRAQTLTHPPAATIPIFISRAARAGRLWL